MRKFMWVVAVGALVLALAAPAMALDFKFGSEYRVRFYSYEGVGFGSTDGTVAGHPRGVQIRVRPRFDASDDNGNIQATWRAEMGDIEFGNGGGAMGPVNSGFGTIGPGASRVGNGSGGSVEADGINIETKWIYVDFAMPWGMPLRVRAGIMPWYLPKGMIVDTDITGVQLYGTYAPFKYQVGWYRASGGPLTTAVPTGAAGLSATTNTFDNNYDLYEIKVDAALLPWLNPGFYIVYGDNRVNCTPTPCPAPASRVRPSVYAGLTNTGKIGIASYDLDVIYGFADGGPNGTFGATATGLGEHTVKGWAIDGGVHFPIGPVTVNLVGSFATGDSSDGKPDSQAFPGGIDPSWSGAGGYYELIGEGGAFDVVTVTQHTLTNLWMLGLVFEYRPVKPLYTKLAWGYAGFTRKSGNCSGAINPCFGPSYPGRPDKPLAGKSGLGNELQLRADYDLWTGFKVQWMLGWLIPVRGDTTQEYIMQFLYNF